MPSESRIDDRTAALLGAARQQSQMLAERRAARFVPLSRWAERDKPGRPTLLSWAAFALGAVLLCGVSVTWALIRRQAPPTPTPSAVTLGEGLAEEARAVGPAPVARRAAPVETRQATRIAERPVVAPPPVAAAPPPAPPPAPPTEETVEIERPEGGEVIIVVPRSQHGPLWTPESFERAIRSRYRH